MTPFNKAWTVLKDSAGLPYKNRPDGTKKIWPKRYTTAGQQKWLPGNQPQKWLPQTNPSKKPISSEYGTENHNPPIGQGHIPFEQPPPQVSTERTEQMGIEDWWKNHPMNPDKTVLNNNPPFGPEGEQQ